MWQRSAPSNQTTPTPQHNSQVEDSPSDLPELLVEETLESQAEYPQEAVEEVEAEVVAEEAAEIPLRPYQHNNQLPMEETNLLETRPSHLQEIAPNQKPL